MKTLRASLVWIILLVNVLMLGALSTQVVRLPEGAKVMFKPQLTLQGTYIDARQWNAADWTRHPELAKRVAEAREEEVASSPAAANNGQVASQKASAAPATMPVAVPLTPDDQPRVQHSIFDPPH